MAMTRATPPAVAIATSVGLKISGAIIALQRDASASGPVPPIWVTLIGTTRRRRGSSGRLVLCSRHPPATSPTPPGAENARVPRSGIAPRCGMRSTPISRGDRRGVHPHPAAAVADGGCIRRRQQRAKPRERPPTWSDLARGAASNLVVQDEAPCDVRWSFRAAKDRLRPSRGSRGCRGRICRRCGCRTAGRRSRRSGRVCRGGTRGPRSSRPGSRSRSRLP